MSDADVHEGGCLCSSVRFSTKGAPRFVAVCHCRFCQRMTGSACNPEVVFLKEDVTFFGNPRRFEYRSPAHNRIMRCHFCPTCGVTVGLSFERFPAVQAVLAGTYDDPAWVRFDKHIFTTSGLPWMAYSESMDLFNEHALSASGMPQPADRPGVRSDRVRR